MNASQWQHTLGQKAVHVHYTELVEMNEMNELICFTPLFNVLPSQPSVVLVAG